MSLPLHPSLIIAILLVLSAESPIAGLIELAKNSKGITDASNAVNAFVENAGLFKDGFEMDDSIISNIEKIVKTLSTGNPQALGALSDVIKSINTIDATKVGLLSQITLPQITPPTADEYERIFKTMQETQPNLIQSISGMFSNAFKRGKVGAAESKLDAISGAADDVTGGKDAVTAAANDIKKASEKGPGVKLAGKTYFTQEEINNATHANGKPVKSSMKSSARRKLDLLQNKSQKINS